MRHVQRKEIGSRKGEITKDICDIIMCKSGKYLNRNVQKCKREYWYSSQEDLLNTTYNPKEFWRKIGKIGVGNERQNSIPLEVKLNDGSSCKK